MFEGERHHRSNDESPYSWLNEWLCEYVDGTMDPSLRKVFEEYLEGNPELAEHVECLCRTRELLCGRSSAANVPRELRERLCQQAEKEFHLRNSSESAPERWMDVYQLPLAVGSGMIGMLIVGMVAGAVLFGPDMRHESASMAITGEDPVETVSDEDATAPAAPDGVSADAGSENPTDAEPVWPPSHWPVHRAPLTPLVAPSLDFTTVPFDTAANQSTPFSDQFQHFADQH